MPSVLIVDDLASIHEMLATLIQAMGFSTSFATDGEEALVRYKEGSYDLVLADIDMQPMDGITLLGRLKAYDPTAVVIIMTAYESIKSAVQALKLGAFDYLQKPFQIGGLIDTLRRGLEFRSQGERARAGIVPELKMADLAGRMIGQSARITKLIAQLKKLAAVRTPVLLIGESGTGKSMVAEILHGASGATETGFVRIDCSLGSEAGMRAGLLGPDGEGGKWVKQARGGTLLLQHLEHLSLPVQQGLVGVLRNPAHDFRLVATTGEDLEQLVAEGKFHDELFYRVASLSMQMPSLRERTEDIPLLVKHSASQATNPLFDTSLLEFSVDALAVLTAYRWPGNLPELHQVVSKISATTETRVITARQLPLRLRALEDWPPLAEYLAGRKKEYSDLVPRRGHGHQAGVAGVLVGAPKLAAAPCS